MTKKGVATIIAVLAVASLGVLLLFLVSV